MGLFKHLGHNDDTLHILKYLYFNAEYVNLPRCLFANCMLSLNNLIEKVAKSTTIIYLGTILFQRVRERNRLWKVGGERVRECKRARERARTHTT